MASGAYCLFSLHLYEFMTLLLGGQGGVGLRSGGAESTASVLILRALQRQMWRLVVTAGGFYSTSLLTLAGIFHPDDISFLFQENSPLTQHVPSRDSSPLADG